MQFIARCLIKTINKKKFAFIWRTEHMYRLVSRFVKTMRFIWSDSMRGKNRMWQVWSKHVDNKMLAILNRAKTLNLWNVKQSIKWHAAICHYDKTVWVNCRTALQWGARACVDFIFFSSSMNSRAVAHSHLSIGLQWFVILIAKTL